MARPGIQTLVPLEADAHGKVRVPDEIHLLTEGDWKTTTIGDFRMTASQLDQMVENFDAGVGQVEGSHRLPINFRHDKGGAASGWMTRFYTKANATTGKKELWSAVEWTPAGRAALEGGEYRYISPEWWLPHIPYEDPENKGSFIANVVTGAGLTNIPLFKKLAPLMASIDAGGSDNQQNLEGGDMTLDDIRAKKLEELNDEEKAFLDEHQDDLTDDERTAFGIEPQDDADAKAKAEADAKEEAEAAEKAKAEELKASTELKGAQAEIDSLRASLEATQRELLKGKLEASVEAHVKRGAIRSDQSEEAVEILLASTSDQRARLETFLDHLPTNQLIASGEIGDNGMQATDAVEQLRQKTQAILKASAEAGTPMTHGEAMSQARRENAELAKEADAGN